MLTALPTNRLLRIVAATPPPMWRPPAIAAMSTASGSDAASDAELWLTELPVIEREPPSRKTPPPSAYRPFGPAATATLSSTDVRTSVRAPSQLWMPPAWASLARLAGPDAAPTRL